MQTQQRDTHTGNIIQLIVRWKVTNLIEYIDGFRLGGSSCI
jgi:hypothetical protein